MAEMTDSVRLFALLHLISTQLQVLITYAEASGTKVDSRELEGLKAMISMYRASLQLNE